MLEDTPGSIYAHGLVEEDLSRLAVHGLCAVVADEDTVVLIHAKLASEARKAVVGPAACQHKPDACRFSSPERGLGLRRDLLPAVRERAVHIEQNRFDHVCPNLSGSLLSYQMLTSGSSCSV